MMSSSSSKLAAALVVLMTGLDARHSANNSAHEALDLGDSNGSMKKGWEMKMTKTPVRKERSREELIAMKK